MGNSLGVKKIYLNRCPMLVESKIIDSQISERLGIDHEKNTKHVLSLKLWRERNAVEFEEKCRAFFRSRKFKSVTDLIRCFIQAGFSMILIRL